MAEKQAREPDRIDEVDPVVLAEFREALELAGKRKAGRLKMRQGRFGEVEAPPYRPPTTQLLPLGPERDDAVYAEILSQGKVLIPELIWMGGRVMPSCTSGWATCCARLGGIPNALEKYRQAYDLDPQDTEAALSLAMCAHGTGDRETAKAKYERVLELSSGKGWFIRLRGSVDDTEAAAIDGLARLKHKQSSPWAAPWEREEAMEVRGGVRPRTQRASGVENPQRKKRKCQRKRRRRR